MVETRHMIVAQVFSRRSMSWSLQRLRYDTAQLVRSVVIARELFKYATYLDVCVTWVPTGATYLDTDRCFDDGTKHAYEEQWLEDDDPHQIHSEYSGNR